MDEDETGDRIISQYYYDNVMKFGMFHTHTYFNNNDSEKPSSFGICYYFNDLVEYDNPFQMTMDDGDD